MLTSTSNARALFEHIRNQPDPFAYLSSLPDPSASHYPFFEEEWLDFKGCPQNDHEAKEIWSKALSGYANITDGLIIWGVDARKTQPRGIDAACGLRLVPDPSAFESKLRDWVRDATNPPVTGVDYKPFPGPNGDGFLVCLIPKSNHKPHRAEWCKKHYYYRAGDDFLMAEPGLLRTLFYPEYRPHLWIEATLTYNMQPPEVAEEYKKSPNATLFNLLVNSQSQIYIDSRIHNDGAATAKDVFVVLQSDAKIDLFGSPDWLVAGTPLGQAALKATRSFHPGEVSRLCYGPLADAFPNNSRASGDDAIVPVFDHLAFRFLIYAENAPAQVITLSFKPGDFLWESRTAVKKGFPEEL